MKSTKWITAISLAFLLPRFEWVLANEFLRPLNRSELSQYSTVKQDQLVRLQNVRVGWVNHGLIRKDFPKLEGFSDEEINHWLIDQFAYIGTEQLKLNGIRQTPIHANESQTKTAFRPKGWNRSAVLEALDSENKVIGMVDVKGIGFGGEWGKAIVESQMQTFEAARKADNLEAINAIRVSDHSDGMMSAGEAIAETSRQQALQRLLEMEGNLHETVETYAVLIPEHEILKDGEKKVPAGLYLRQAHFGRKSGLEVSEKIYTDRHGHKQRTDTDTAVDMGGVIIQDARIKSRFESVEPGREDPQYSRAWADGHDTAEHFVRGQNDAIHGHLSYMLNPLDVDYHNFLKDFDRSLYVRAGEAFIKKLRENHYPIDTLIHELKQWKQDGLWMIDLILMSHGSKADSYQKLIQLGLRHKNETVRVKALQEAIDLKSGSIDPEYFSLLEKGISFHEQPDLEKAVIRELSQQETQESFILIQKWLQEKNFHFISVALKILTKRKDEQSQDLLKQILLHPNDSQFRTICSKLFYFQSTLRSDWIYTPTVLGCLDQLNPDKKGRLNDWEIPVSILKNILDSVAQRPDDPHSLKILSDTIGYHFYSRPDGLYYNPESYQHSATNRREQLTRLQSTYVAAFKNILSKHSGSSDPVYLNLLKEVLKSRNPELHQLTESEFISRPDLTSFLTDATQNPTWGGHAFSLSLLARRLDPDSKTTFKKWISQEIEHPTLSEEGYAQLSPALSGRLDSESIELFVQILAKSRSIEATMAAARALETSIQKLAENPANPKHLDVFAHLMRSKLFKPGFLYFEQLSEDRKKIIIQFESAFEKLFKSIRNHPEIEASQTQLSLLKEALFFTQNSKIAQMAHSYWTERDDALPILIQEFNHLLRESKEDRSSEIRVATILCVLANRRDDASQRAMNEIASKDIRISMLTPKQRLFLIQSRAEKWDDNSTQYRLEILDQLIRNPKLNSEENWVFESMMFESILSTLAQKKDEPSKHAYESLIQKDMRILMLTKEHRLALVRSMKKLRDTLSIQYRLKFLFESQDIRDIRAIVVSFSDILRNLKELPFHDQIQLLSKLIEYHIGSYPAQSPQAQLEKMENMDSFSRVFRKSFKTLMSDASRNNLTQDPSYLELIQKAKDSQDSELVAMVIEKHPNTQKEDNSPVNKVIRNLEQVNHQLTKQHSHLCQ